MRARECLREERHNERGVSILLVAVGMVFVLGMAGLGVDLASLYVGRSQAQRAADAGALAGAQALVSSGCTTSLGPDISPGCQAIARQRAVTVGNANFVAGVSPGITNADVTFPSTNTSDPQVKVVASRDATHGNPMPTFFIKIFGINSANVSASAKAEAFNPTGSNTGIALSCVKPWLLPNCDPTRPLLPGQGGNPNCPVSGGGNYDYFVLPDGSAVAHPGPASSGGVQGEQMTIKPGDPTSSATASPGKFWPVFLPAGSVATVCPSCANGSSTGGPSSASLYKQNVECCNNSLLSCSVTIQPITGNMVGPTEQGVDCLIHQGGTKSNPIGMDIMTLNTSGDPLWTITGGSLNPYPGQAGATIATSDSIVTIPIYDGSELCPGNSCPSTTTVNLMGYLQVFIRYEMGNNQGDVLSYIMNVTAVTCSGGGGGGSSEVAAGGSSPIPVRLIQ
jgi:hypothetical protein